MSEAAEHVGMTCFKVKALSFLCFEQEGQQETTVSMEFTPLPPFPNSKQRAKHISHSGLKSAGFQTNYQTLNGIIALKKILNRSNDVN